LARQSAIPEVSVQHSNAELHQTLVKKRQVEIGGKSSHSSQAFAPPRKRLASKSHKQHNPEYISNSQSVSLTRIKQLHFFHQENKFKTCELASHPRHRTTKSQGKPYLA